MRTRIPPKGKKTRNALDASTAWAIRTALNLDGRDIHHTESGDVVQSLSGLEASGLVGAADPTAGCAECQPREPTGSVGEGLNGGWARVRVAATAKTLV